jgi:hypothetical protein
MTEAIRRFPLRLRYALIARIGSTELFDEWPQRVRGHRHLVPELYRSAIRQINLAGADTLEAAKRIARHLSWGHPRGRSLSTHLTAALGAIRRRCGGCCSDYAQVYVALCAAAGLAAREWGLCDSFTTMRVGHCFNEVFSVEHRKWVMVDPFLTVHATSGDTPLGVTEIVDKFAAGRGDDVQFHLLDEAQRALAASLLPYYYVRPDNLYFLTGQYDVFEEDQVLRRFGWLPTSLLHSVLLLAGRYHRFWLYTNAANRSRVEREVGTARTLRYLALGR